MSTEKCDEDVYKYGVSCGIFDMTKPEAEAYCLAETEETGRKYDWHFVAGRVHVKAMPETPMVSVPKDVLEQLLDMQGTGGNFFL